MQFELWQLFLVAVLYLGLLFLIATATERGWIPESVVRHPMVYTLSIGVYATSWSFYGSVGFAQKEGFNFLTIYLGATLAFLASPILLRPILRLTETYRLASLADLFAFRYHSQLAGILVTLLMLAGTLPYMSLQIQAVTNTIIVVLIALLMLFPPLLNLWTAEDNAWFTPYLVWSGVILLSYLLQKKLK